MKVQVNLLPESYLRVRLRHRRFKQGLVLGVVLLAVEIAGGMALHAHARRTQNVLTEIEGMRRREQRLRKELNEPLQESERLDQEILLAEQLRSKHYWSRLLSTLSATTPPRVLLTNVATDPPRWSKSLHRSAPSASRDTEKNKALPEEEPERTPLFLRGMTLRGFAADHEAMAEFVTRVHESKLFRSLDIRETRRETLLGKKGVAFELVCHW